MEKSYYTIMLCVYNIFYILYFVYVYNKILQRLDLYNIYNIMLLYNFSEQLELNVGQETTINEIYKFIFFLFLHKYDQVSN